jgi:hypothetical protein
LVNYPNIELQENAENWMLSLTQISAGYLDTGQRF